MAGGHVSPAPSSTTDLQCRVFSRCTVPRRQKKERGDPAGVFLGGGACGQVVSGLETWEQWVLRWQWENWIPGHGLRTSERVWELQTLLIGLEQRRRLSVRWLTEKLKSRWSPGFSDDRSRPHSGSSLWEAWDACFLWNNEILWTKVKDGRTERHCPRSTGSHQPEPQIPSREAIGGSMTCSRRHAWCCWGCQWPNQPGTGLLHSQTEWGKPHSKRRPPS